MKKGDYPKIINEVRAHIEMEHPNIIELIDYQQKINMIYLLLEFAENGTLYAYLNNMRILPVKLITKIFVQVIQAIQYIHDKGFLHRDIKPENILLDSDNNAKLSDFGLCVEETNMAERTTADGTYEYMSPESLRKELQGKECDIWALGVLLYELFHNKAPYPGASTAEIQAAMEKEIDFLSHVPSDARDLIHKILMKDPRERISLADMLEHPFVRSNYSGSFLSPGPGKKKRGLNIKDQIAKNVSEKNIPSLPDDIGIERKNPIPTVNDPTRGTSSRTIDDVLRGVPSQKFISPMISPNISLPQYPNSGQNQGETKNDQINYQPESIFSQGRMSGNNTNYSPTGYYVYPTEQAINNQVPQQSGPYQNNQTPFTISPQQVFARQPSNNELNGQNIDRFRSFPQNSYNGNSNNAKNTIIPTYTESNPLRGTLLPPQQQYYAIQPSPMNSQGSLTERYSDNYQHGYDISPQYLNYEQHTQPQGNQHQASTYSMAPVPQTSRNEPTLPLFSRPPVQSSRLSETSYAVPISPSRISHGNLPMPRDYGSPPNRNPWQRTQTLNVIQPEPTSAFTSGIRTSYYAPQSQGNSGIPSRTSPTLYSKPPLSERFALQPSHSQQAHKIEHQTTTTKSITSPSHMLQGLISPQNTHSYRPAQPQLSDRYAFLISERI